MKKILTGIAALWEMTDASRRWTMGLLLLLMFAQVVAEFVGITMILPLLTLAMGQEERALIGGPFARLQDLGWSFQTFGCVILGALVAKGVLMVLLAALQTRFTAGLRSEWSRRILDTALHTPLPLISQGRVGEWVESLGAETEKGSNAVLTLLDVIRQAALSLVLVVGLLLAEARISLGLLAVALVVYGALRLFRVFQGTRQGERMVRNSLAISSVAVEAVSNVRLIKIHDAYAQRLGALRSALDDYAEAKVRFQISSRLVKVVFEVVIAGAILGGIMIAHARDPVALRQSIPLYVMMISFGHRLIAAAGGLSGTSMKLSVGLTNVMQVHRYLARSALQAMPREDLDAGAPFPPIREGISLREVSYAWPGGEDVLRGVSLTLPRGVVTALCGPSGCGKSTVAAMVAGLLRPRAGQVLADGAPLAGYALRSVRARVGYMPQEVELFHGTVRDNIRMGDPEASEAEVVAAARRACADAFVRALPNGYDTLVGERGSTLSGGQRQRIALARMLLQPRSIYIFDEVTSALDEEARAVVQAAIRESAREAVVVLITHNPAVTDIADRVYRFDGAGGVEPEPAGAAPSDAPER